MTEHFNVYKSWETSTPGTGQLHCEQTIGTFKQLL